jgi:hypothetical protein
MDIDINLDSFAKLYNEGDNITGTIVVTSNERLVEFSKINLILTVRQQLTKGAIYH